MAPEEKADFTDYVNNYQFFATHLPKAHSREAVDKFMAHVNPNWPQYAPVIRGFYFFSQVATVDICNRLLNSVVTPKTEAALRDFKQAFPAVFLQEGAFEERPFSQLKVYVWQMATLQLLSDFNMLAYHDARGSRPLPPKVDADFFPLAAFMSDMDEMVAMLDAQEEHSMPVADTIAAVAASLGSALNPHMMAAPEDIPSEIMEALGADISQLDNYQIVQRLNYLESGAPTLQELSLFAFLYFQLGFQPKNPDDFADFVALRMSFAARYIMDHVEHMDAGGKPEDFDVHALWKAFMQVVRAFNWDLPEETRLEVQHLFNMYAGAEEFFHTATVDANGSSVVLVGTVHPWLLDSQRALSHVVFLNTPDSVSKKLYPRN